MKFIGKILLIVGLAAAILWGVDIFQDRQLLSNELIRLHVVANSDSEEDQDLKLQVRDAITAYLQENLPQNASKEETMAFLTMRIPELTETANRTLEEAGSTDRAVVTLTREAFPKRQYESFALPAGVYDSLRIRIGSAQGQNWWCVVFPSLCFAATGEETQEVGAAFDEPLTGALEGEKPYQVRFFLLDCLGWLQNFFHQF
jgi:stage II sporulation protein R